MCDYVASWAAKSPHLVCTLIVFYYGWFCLGSDRSCVWWGAAEESSTTLTGVYGWEDLCYVFLSESRRLLKVLSTLRQGTRRALLLFCTSYS